MLATSCCERRHPPIPLRITGEQYSATTAVGADTEQLVELRDAIAFGDVLENV